MGEHTPGPWRLSAESEGYCRVEAGRGYYTGPFVDTGFEVTGFTGEANARLIAAAPDLLAALEEIAHNWEIIDEDDDAIFNLSSEFIEAWREAGEIANAAIAKAKGVSHA